MACFFPQMLEAGSFENLLVFNRFSCSTIVPEGHFISLFGLRFKLYYCAGRFISLVITWNSFYFFVGLSFSFSIIVSALLKPHFIYLSKPLLSKALDFYGNMLF